MQRWARGFQTTEDRRQSTDEAAFVPLISVLCPLTSETREHHGLFNGIIMLPTSGQAGAKLECELGIVASGPGLPSKTGLLSPPAPGVRGSPGPTHAQMSA